MDKKKNKLITLEKYYIFFMLYAIIGWMYEVFLEFFVFKRGFVNRGVLFGCYCPVYGFGALAFIFIIYPLIKNKPLKSKLLMIPIVFIGCTFVATFIELITSYLCEYFLGNIPWDYTIYKYNFQSRIALSPSIRFGIGGLIFLYILQPLFEMFVNKLNNKTLNRISIGVLIIFLIDIIHIII